MKTPAGLHGGFAALVVLLLFLAGYTPATAQSFTSNAAYSWLNEGARDLDQGRIADGIALTRKAIRSNDLGPSSIAVAHNNLCMGYSLLEAYERALEHCEIALKVGRDWRFYNNRGTALMGLGDYEGALRDYRRALKSRADSPVVLRNIRLAEQRLSVAE